MGAPAALREEPDGISAFAELEIGMQVAIDAGAVLSEVIIGPY